MKQPDKPFRRAQNASSSSAVAGSSSSLFGDIFSPKHGHSYGLSTEKKAAAAAADGAAPSAASTSAAAAALTMRFKKKASESTESGLIVKKGRILSDSE